jgi:drug/metabolite transporter (DMT)-like permease
VVQVDPLFVGLVVIMPLTLGYGAILFVAIRARRRGIVSPRTFRRFLVAGTLTIAAFGGLAALGLTGNLLVAAVLVVTYVVGMTVFSVLGGIRRGRRGAANTRR